MRIVLVFAALALAVPRDAAACFEPGFEQHELDRSQLDDTVKPGPVAISMWIEGPDGGGCSMPERRCGPSGRSLVVMVSASDDQTPPDRLGYRVTVTAGKAPFAVPGDVRAIDEMLVFPLGESTDYDFELAIRAIDLNGNMGPATYTQVAEASGEGCASHHAGGAMSFGLLALVTGFVARRRRRRH